MQQSVATPLWVISFITKNSSNKTKCSASFKIEFIPLEQSSSLPEERNIKYLLIEDMTRKLFLYKLVQNNTLSSQVVESHSHSHIHLVGIK